ncbi:37S ribosomal protein S16, mitochondrial [Wickerhamiella sorbophila]|uniref:37S ribosomal protein S16, mitochondrial n=1 Tax=Wickerhamiella sorbophila TaxID=45607 RepID=A0A2T0FF31_9ASCO|nr:37S ribosomal protein S16, mitochondrial [Wickerhamiella sorbophila]PRT53606.1 37S ribosomal protein S16, mitochondrial [Wickerhamiella sorbophila]
MKGSVRIRLARFGRKHEPVYNIVVSQAKKAPQKLPIEVLGTYNPVALPLSPQAAAAGEIPIKDVRLDFMRSKYWIGVGAQPTPTVARLFKKAGILPPGWPGPRKEVPVPERKVVRPLTEAGEPEQPPVR